MKLGMFFRGIVYVTFSIFLSAEDGLAATLPSAKARCDSNGDGLITGSEIRGLARLQVSPELQSYDQDCDGRISGAELDYINQLITTALEEDGGLQEGELTFQSQNGPIEVPTPENKPEEPTQRFFLSKNRVTPSLDPLTKSGATFAFADDAETGQQTLNVDGVLTYLLLNPDRTRPEDSSLSGFSLATYLDLKGTVNSDADDTTSAIIGFDSFYDFESTSTFDRQTLRVGPYFQTDFDGDAEVYGLSASWVPVRIDWQLGSGRTGTGDLREHFLWFASGDIDFRNVNQTGETQLPVGEQLWAGISLGGKVYPFGTLGSPTPHLEFGLNSHRDLTNGDDATLSTVSLSFPLSADAKDKSAFVLSYENGENYRTGEQLDKTTIGFSYKF